MFDKVNYACGVNRSMCYYCLVIKLIKYWLNQLCI